MLAVFNRLNSGVNFSYFGNFVKSIAFHFTQCLMSFYTSFQWAEDGQGFQMQYLTLDTDPEVERQF